MGIPWGYHGEVPMGVLRATGMKVCRDVPSDSLRPRHGTSWYTTHALKAQRVGAHGDSIGTPWGSHGVGPE